MERINILEEKIVNDYVAYLIKEVNNSLSGTLIDFPYDLKTMLMNTFAKHMRTAGDQETLRFSVGGPNLEEDIKKIVKEKAIELFIKKLDLIRP